MSSDRRKFIKGLVAGTAGIALGGFSSGSVRAAYVASNSSLSSSVYLPRPPVFPFFRYAGKYNIGEYIPKDQGGKFIQMAMLCTEDDAAITDAVNQGALEERYGKPVIWDRYEKTEIEKSVWLNRFYFLPSFARMYYLTSDRSYLDEMMTFIRVWIEENPRRPDSHLRTYNWRDMQVAWRSIHLSWCYFLAGDGLNKDEKSLITDTLKEHAHILVTGFGTAPLNEFNHQSHGALAMLYLGILFPDLEQSEELMSRGKLIIEHHLNNAIRNDGGNVEQMFGYYPFEAHIFRDAYILMAANGITPPANMLAVLGRMYAYLYAVSRPDNTMPQVNDSYEMPSLPVMETINDLLDNRLPPPGYDSHYFPDTQIAVLRDGRPGKWYILANPAAVIGAHAHAGRLGFELWYDNHPLIIDSGCCNYDNPELVKWYRTTKAHNTVIIDGKCDKASSSDNLWNPRRETLNRITQWSTGKELSYITMASPPEEEANASVKWSRSIILVGDKFMILSDRFETAGEHTYELLLHFPPVPVSMDQSQRALLVQQITPAEIVPADPEMISDLVLQESMVSIEGVSTPSTMATYKIAGSGTTHSCLLFLPAGNREKKHNIVMKKLKGRSLLIISDEEGKKTKITFANEQINLL